ncbi:3-hydroxyacyl-CoA dehydrogenase [Sphingobium sp. YR657]|uniref:3-hydroxyacyl-CoA dehydrogenase n=1 Tax=Sphingobium sp. YR657 TaxID=1884366 RepID=UPI0009324892|nr:3-hydroxyacyl-CoA dehydrogenase [Sphingobium sp. YR657]
MSSRIDTVGVVGTGVMGAGIAQIAAAAGIKVRLFDAREGAAAAACEGLRATFDKLVAKGKMEPDAAQAAMARLSPEPDIAALKDCGLVIEAIVERLDAKQQLIAQLEDVVSADAILATNTSSLSVTAIAVECRHPERVAGFHFFNPVPLMRVVEIIPGFATSEGTTQALSDLAKKLGHRGVVVKDTPGFIINHAGRAYGTEALRIVEEGVASFPQVDAILRDAVGFRMGPFELFDLTGLDVSHPATRAIFEQFYGDPRYKPSYIAEQRVVARELGRKTGRGFYNYGAAAACSTSTQVTPGTEAADLPAVWIAPSADFDTADLAALVGACGGAVDHDDSPQSGSLILMAPLGEDATSAALRLGYDPTRTVGIDLFTGVGTHRTLMGTPALDARFADAARTVLTRDGGTVTFIGDSTGFVAQRVLAMVVNLACEIAQQRIASPRDIDDAVRIGLGYPTGPLSWGDSLGADKILTILTRIHALSGDPRYRPGPWLRRRATLGLSLLHDEQPGRVKE